MNNLLLNSIFILQDIAVRTITFNCEHNVGSCYKFKKYRATRYRKIIHGRSPVSKHKLKWAYALHSYDRMYLYVRKVAQQL